MCLQPTNAIIVERKRSDELRGGDLSSDDEGRVSLFDPSSSSFGQPTDASGKVRRSSGTGEPLMLGPADRVTAFRRFVEVLQTHPTMMAALEAEHRELVMRFIDVDVVVQVSCPCACRSCCLRRSPGERFTCAPRRGATG